MSRFIVGITGGIAMGKTHVTDSLKKLGAKIVDADEISRSLTAPDGKALPLIREVFGEDVFENGLLNRKKLGSVVFHSEEHRKKLENILHPLIFSEMRKALDAEKGVVFLSVPLLYECGLETWCQEVWCMYIPKEEQIQRLMTRDHCTRESALSRIQSQMPSEEKKRRSQLIIPTDGTLEETEKLVSDAYFSLLHRLFSSVS